MSRFLHKSWLDVPAARKAPARPRRAAMPYRHALQWLLDNDDCEWLDDSDAPGSVTAAFIADCYGRDDAELRGDLVKLKSRRKRAS